MDITKSLNVNLKKLDRLKQQAVKGLLKTLKHIEAERKKRTADLDHAARSIMSELTQWGHSPNKSGKASVTKGKTVTKSKRRVRRSAEQLKDEATKILAFVRGAKDGIGGSEIRKKFPAVGPDIKGFVQKHSGQKLKTTGERVKMKYHAA